MKANRKFITEDNDAVSPVIAVILMVAITVVLAATVFVLVNDLGKNVGTTGPQLGLVSASTSSTSNWVISVSSATQLADLTDYRFVLTTPTLGTVVAQPPATPAQFAAGYTMHNETVGTGRHTAEPNALDPAAVGFQMTWTDIDGNGKWSVGDTLRIQYGDGTALGATFPAGEYQVQILHITSGSGSGSLPRTF